MNCWVQRFARELRLGEPAGTDTVAVPDRVALLGTDDAFAGRQLDLDRWRIAYADADYPGMRVCQEEGLVFLFPPGYSNRVLAHDPPVVRSVGVTPPGTVFLPG